MNSNQQAQKGFKTFILTLSISLIVFSVIYYMLNSTPTEVDETVTASTEVYKETEDVLGTEDKTVFGRLVEQKMDVPSKAVLSGMDSGESTESTSPVPDTGSLSVTLGLIVSMAIFVVGLFIIYQDPRKTALLGFEKKILEDL